MSQASTTVPEFGFVDSLPKAAVEETKKGVGAMRRVLDEYARLTAERGPIVPISTVAEHMGVSRQAVIDYIDRGRLETVTIGGRRWVVGVSVIRLMEAGPKPGGRPKKLSKVANGLRLGKELAESAEGVWEA